jgi:CheY-like chemotaxis protein
MLVIDERLPDGAGLAAATEIQARLGPSRIPVLLLVSHGRQPPAEALAAANIHCCAVKPLRRHVLVDRIKEMASGPAPRPQAISTPQPKALLAERIPLRILLVEDNPVNKKVALRLLDRLGYTADAASSGAEAIQAVSQGSYQLVFMDVQMPEIDGLEATRRIRTLLPAERQPQIVALTANALVGDAEMCREAGMDDYVSKPVTPEDIHNAIVRRFGAGLEIGLLSSSGRG